MPSIFVSIFTGIITASFSSWVTVKLSVKKFQKEKFWDNQLRIYTSIIEGLHTIREYRAFHEQFITGETDISSIPKSELEQRRATYNLAKDALLRSMIES